MTSKPLQKTLLKDLAEILALHDDIKKNGTKAIDFQKQIEYISSNISNLTFYPWQKSDEKTDLATLTGPTKFEDPDGLPLLSSKQIQIFQGWARAELALGAPTSMTDAGAETLCQDSLEDCSFVASILSIFFYEKRHGLALLKKNIYPQDTQGNPIVSPTGKYWVRIYFNGTMRRVTVDDQLPTTKNPTKHSLFLRSATNPGLLWPAILEKAYLKLMGGYDFLGSYSACDTYALCSWIPEVVFINGYFQEANASRGALWNKMYKPFQEGNLMICVGTGSISRAESEAYGLIGNHDYTVMDLREVAQPDGSLKRIVQIKNPWLSEQSTNKLGSIQIPPSEAPEALYGSFWVTFDSLCLRFSSLYFNWNYKLFSHQITTNFLWSTKSIEFANKSRSYSSNPQFSIRNESPYADVAWLLLSRHLTDRDSVSGYVSLHIYEANGSRVYTPDEYPCKRKGTFLNTYHYVLKLSIPAKTTYTVVVGGNDIVSKYSSLRFSLTAYSLLPLTLKKASEEFPYKKVIDGIWEGESAGGSWANDTYLNNPRFLLKVSQTISTFKLGLVSDSGTPINFRLYMADYMKSRNFQAMKTLTSSGEYRIGTTVSKTSNLTPGSYMIVASMFEPNVTGTFTLVARGSEDFELSQLPSINAGMFKRSLQLDWDGTARKEITFSMGNRCTAYFRTATCKSMGQFDGQASASQYRPHLRVSIFEAPSNQLIYSSKEFTDNEFGVYLDGLQFYPNMKYICLIERMERGYGGVLLEVHSTSPVILNA